ncbi:MAG: ribonucleoside triphosphate reductase [Bacteroidales bacterium]|nr:ribonucleoside triphosphate reductase [Bacteroidales bacterium]
MLKEDWRVTENSNAHYSYGALNRYISGKVSALYWLNKVYPQCIAEQHVNGFMHIHDLSSLSIYCSGYSIRDIAEKGIRGISNIPTSAPPKHFMSLLNQIANITTIYQNEISGAVAFSSFDTLCAPFVKEDKLTYQEVKQYIQNFIYSINSNSRGGCVPITTELLTKDGFKKYNEIKDGDLVFTYKNGDLKLSPVKRINVYDYDGDLISFEGRDYKQTVTPNHRVLRKNFNRNSFTIQRAEELQDVKTPMSFPVGTNSSSIDGISLSNDMIELLAFVLTDGCIDKSRIRIYKSNNRWGGKRLEEILNRIGAPYTKSDYSAQVSIDDKNRKYPMSRYTILDSSIRDTINEILNNTKKDIPNILLGMNQAQAKLFLKTWSKLDGSAERFLLQCDNKNIADKMQYIATLSGHGSYQYVKEKSETNKTLYVQVYKEKNKCNCSINKIPYKGKVWCPTTGDGIVFFREDNKVYISGNSEPAFSNITIDLTPPKDLLNQPVIVGGKLLDYTYKECQKEMDMINRAIYEIMLEGDYAGAPFAYPILTYNIHDRFDWDNPNNELLWQMTGKYGLPYFANFINSDMEPSDVRSMCCRLRLSLSELRKRGGGLFGSGEHTGSIGVVTLNLPRYAYLAKKMNDETQFWWLLKKHMDIAMTSLEYKRSFLQEQLDRGLLPAFSEYVGGIDNYFSTIGLVGMNEMCLNLLDVDITDPKGKAFSERVLDCMRERIIEYQERTGNLYNLEATPAEGCSYRLAKMDVERFNDIIVQGTRETPYYTNSCHMPVNKVETVKQLMEHQEGLQLKFTGGTVVHLYLSGAISGDKAKHIVRTVCENYRVPYISLSPVYSICPNHGYLSGYIKQCPICQAPVESYQRVTGYIRQVSKFNDGKKAEFHDRKQLEV